VGAQPKDAALDVCVGRADDPDNNKQVIGPECVGQLEFVRVLQVQDLPSDVRMLALRKPVKGWLILSLYCLLIQLREGVSVS